MERIYNYLKLSDDLSCSGMPALEQIPVIAENGVQVVINLATLASEGALPNEKELVEAYNIRYYNIPVDWENPTTENLHDFTQIMDQHKGEKILVHCKANYRATGFITLYRIKHLGWDRENAFKDLKRIWNPADYPAWEKFIEENLPAKQ